jgi:tetratricopeptide (TPR) repeat protein
MDRLETLKHFLAEDPDDAFTRFALAQEYRQRGDLAEATRLFEDLVRDEPDYVGTYFHLGRVYEDAGRPDDAIRTYRAGIERATDARDLHARAELQGALLAAQGIGFDDDE